MDVFKLVMVLVGYAISGAITWVIVACNRKAAERASRIDQKNELLRNVEQRAIYIWSVNKSAGFNFALEDSYLNRDFRRMNDHYKSLGKAGKDYIPPELDALEVIATAAKGSGPESFAPEKRQEIAEQIESLVEKLESIPRK